MKKERRNEHDIGIIADRKVETGFLKTRIRYLQTAESGWKNTDLRGLWF